MFPGLINPNRNNPANPNLVAGVTAASVERPAGFWLALGIDILAVLTALSVGTLYFRWIEKGGGLAWLIALTALLSLLLFFGSLFTLSKKRRLLIAILAAAGLVAAFYSVPLRFWLAVFGVIALFLLWAEAQSGELIRNSLTFRYPRIASAYFNKLITGLVLAAVLLFLPFFSADRAFFSPDGFRSFFLSLEGAVNNFYLNLQLDGTIADFAESVAAEKLAGNPAYTQLLPAAKDSALIESRNQILESLRQLLQMPIEPEESTTQVFYRYSLNTVDYWQDRFGGRFLAIWGILLFIVIRGFGFVFYVVTAGLGYFLLQILLAMDVYSIVGESAVKETLVYGIGRKR